MCVCVRTVENPISVSFPPNEKSTTIIPFYCTVELFNSLESIVAF